MKRLLSGVIIGAFVLLALTSCLNIFSVFQNGDPQTVNNVDHLIDMGNHYISELEYDKAYDAFQQALLLDPNRSEAREGVATAYLFWKIPVTNIIQSIIDSDYSRIDFSTLYDASHFVSSNLYFIINNSSDGVIDTTDGSVNLNFFVFNTVYAAFYLADSDNDGNVDMDSNDYFIIYPDFSFSNNLPDTTNFFAALKMANSISKKTNTFFSLIDKSHLSLSNLSMGLSSSEAKDFLSNIEVQIDGISETLNSNLNLLTNFNSISQFGLSNSSDITNLIWQQGYTNETQFYSDLSNAGFTNINDLTNIFPDLTNIESLVSNLYN